MSYSLNRELTGITFEKAIEHVTEMLKTEGFGVLAEIDISTTFKNKLNVDFRKYKILGACNPQFAYKAIQNNDRTGVFLPCNVVVQEIDNGVIEVMAMNPVPALGLMENNEIDAIAEEIRQKITRVLEKL